MSTWNTTSTNSRFGSTVVGPAIEGSSSTAWRSKQSLSIPFRTSPWSNVPREQRVRPQPVGAKTGNLSEVNNHLWQFQAIAVSTREELTNKVPPWGLVSQLQLAEVHPKQCSESYVFSPLDNGYYRSFW